MAVININSIIECRKYIKLVNIITVSYKSVFKLVTNIFINQSEIDKYFTNKVGSM